jgi:hypothetical protein
MLRLPSNSFDDLPVGDGQKKFRCGANRGVPGYSLARMAKVHCTS